MNAAMRISALIDDHLNGAFAEMQRLIDKGEITPAEAHSTLSLVWGHAVVDAWDVWYSEGVES